VRYRNDLVTGPDIGREKCEVQCACASIDADTNPGAGECGKLLFEFRDFATESKLAGIQYSLDGSIYLALDAGVLSFQINEWNQVKALLFSNLQNERMATHDLTPVSQSMVSGMLHKRSPGHGFCAGSMSC
jgi:hypothetical protein